MNKITASALIGFFIVNVFLLYQTYLQATMLQVLEAKISQNNTEVIMQEIEDIKKDIQDEKDLSDKRTDAISKYVDSSSKLLDDTIDNIYDEMQVNRDAINTIKEILTKLLNY